MSGKPEASSVERALLLLEALLEQPQGVELSDLLLRLDMARSSLFVLLHRLKQLGYIEQGERRGRYRAGPRLLAWHNAGRSPSEANLLPAFFQEVQACELGETLALFAPLAEGEMVLIAQVEGRRGVRSVFEAAQRLPASSAAGQLFQVPIAEAVRQRGYALARRGEAMDLAFPVCRDGFNPSFALIASVPAFRWDEATEREFVIALREIAARLSYRLGALSYSPWREEAAEISETLPLDESQIAVLLKAPWAARLACLRPDGIPHVVSVWHEWDGKTFHVVAWKGSRWGEYLLNHPQVSLTIDEPFLPLRRVSVKGVAYPGYAPPDARLDQLLIRLRRRYLGQNLAAALPLQVERSFVIVPSTLRGWQGIA
uniref:HTH iclR-type domain-containing protein n=1 Tax=uncultured Chloroflexota bacterium TaxID=166587 RepID=H5SFM5_9CHLR|nr:hypothetical protein HGMM_F22C05C07 [uncultured Chloroflexota bacterium]